MSSECKLLNKKAKAAIAFKNGALVFGLFFILGNHWTWKLVGRIFNGASADLKLRDNQDATNQIRAFVESDNVARKQLANAVIKQVGGVKITWKQVLFHALLAGLITTLITYLGMDPGKDSESCPKPAKPA